MKCQLRWLQLGCFAIILLLPAFCQAETTVMRVGTILQIQPEHPIVQLMQRAYAELGFEMQLELMPTERALRELNKGELLDANLAATRIFEKNNPGLLRVPVMIYQLEFCVFSNDRSLSITDWSQLQPYNVVMITGMAVVKHRLEQTPGQQIEAVLSIEQALRLVELGRNQLAVLPKFEAEAMLNKLQLKKVRALSPSLAVVPAYHYLHPKHQSLLEPLAIVLSRLTGQPIESAEASVATSAVGSMSGNNAGRYQAVKSSML